MSPRDMGLAAASDGAVGSVGTAPLAVELCGPLGCCGLATPGTTVAYASPPSVGPSCRLLWVASSPVVPWASGPSSNRCLGAGRRLSGSDGQPELESSSAFLLLTLGCREARDVQSSPPTQLGRSRAEALLALTLVAARAFFFLPATIAFLSSRRNTGESSMLPRALIKSTSSCFSVTPSAGGYKSVYLCNLAILLTIQPF